MFNPLLFNPLLSNPSYIMFSPVAKLTPSLFNPSLSVVLCFNPSLSKHPSLTTVLFNPFRLQVIEGCAAGRFDPGLSFGRFKCNYQDICYRVYRLVRDGYLYHENHNEQMLWYIPDNLSATARVSANEALMKSYS